MPGRVGPPRSLSVPKWWASALASVPSQWPLAGWTIIPAGLFDDDDRLVFVQNRRAECPAARALRAARRVAARRRRCRRPQPQRRLARRIVDAHVPGVDRPPQRGPAERRQLLGEKHVEPLPGLLRRDRESLRPR